MPNLIVTMQYFVQAKYDVPGLGVVNFTSDAHLTLTMEQFLQVKNDVPKLGVLNFTSDAQPYPHSAPVSPGQE
jgi:hypothetical protein